MLGPRWNKIVNDLWTNRSRTFLVILSIAVGVMAVGMVMNTQEAIGKDMAAIYAAIDPADVTLVTDEPFDEELVQAVRDMREVKEAEGRRSLNVRFLAGPDEWKQIKLFAIEDYDDMRVNKIASETGDWPPPKHALLIERGSMEAGLGLDGKRLGDTLLVEPPNRKLREIRIAGLAHDIGQLPAVMSDAAYGYITFDTLKWLGEPSHFNEMHVVVAGNPTTKAKIAEIAGLVERKIEKSGRLVETIQVNEPGKSPVDDTIQTVLLLMSVLGFFALLLSAFLVVNTITSVLTQQIKQIGIMKSIGAGTSQITQMYFVMVSVFGGGALLLGIPLGILGASGTVGLVAGMLNYDIRGLKVSSGVVSVQVAIGLMVPLLAALYPVITGTRTTIREAISGYGVGSPFGRGIIDQSLQKVRFLSHPMRLSLRNTFRKRSRLALTLSTLVLAGAAFIAIACLRDALFLGMDEMFGYFRYDVEVTFDRRYRAQEVEEEALRVPGVIDAESWLVSSAIRIREDDSESNRIGLIGLPSDTNLMRPVVVKGRWLLPEDENAVVINAQITNEEPDVQVGDRIRLEVEGVEQEWHVVGRVKTAFVGPQLYANRPYLSRILNDVGKANKVQVVSQGHETEYQANVLSALESRFKQAGLRIQATETSGDIREFSEAGYGIMIAFLMVMALLLAIVGGLGLMGTMGINVLERTREIGVMRAIGASNWAVMQNVMAEGILIGWMSWVMATLGAIPLGRLLTDAVGMAFMQEKLTYTFSVEGALLWLGIVTVIATLASYLPARRASQLTVREVLAYE